MSMLRRSSLRRADSARESARSDPLARPHHRTALQLRHLNLDDWNVPLRRIRPDLAAERVAEFRGQVARRLSGELTEDEFKPLRLMNGLYLQLHAYMLRIAIPYGTLASRQMRKLAHIARTLRPRLRPFHHAPEPPVQLDQARRTCRTSWTSWPTSRCTRIQTSGNCIRNVTADHFAGAAADEIEDPRVCAEIMRQWSTLHPEFTFLPRKFKIAVTGAPSTTAPRIAGPRSSACGCTATAPARLGFEVWVGGGLGPHADHRQDDPRRSCRSATC